MTSNRSRENKMTGKLMTWLAVVMMVAVGATAQAQLQPLERIGIRPGEDGAQFVLKGSGNPFFVKGFNVLSANDEIVIS